MQIYTHTLPGGAQLIGYLRDRTVEMPAFNTRPAILILPGGGYAWCSKREADPVAMQFLQAGYNVFTLYYTCRSDETVPALRWQPLIDAAGAILHIRRNAEQFGTDPAKIAICGFSAGGHLAASAATMLPEEVRPAFAVLVYPVITAEPGKCHKGSFDNLLGTDRTAGDEAQWSLQNRVTASTPPALLLAADDDRSVPPVNSVLFYAALKRHGIPASLRIYPSGGHGGALDPAHIYRAQWRADILDWLAMLAHENQKPTSKPR